VDGNAHIPEFQEEVAPYKALQRPPSNGNSNHISKGSVPGKSKSNQNFGDSRDLETEKPRFDCILCVPRENGECGVAEDEREGKCFRKDLKQSF